MSTKYKTVQVERSYDQRVNAILAFNQAEKAGKDRDDALDAAWIAMLEHSPQPPASHPKPETMSAMGNPISAAAHDVLAERQRQIEAEGWTPERDDQYKHGDMASAAACYATQGRYHYPEHGKPGPTWPWDASWWKPSTYRRNLVKAGALILAEIERLDRAAKLASDWLDQDTGEQRVTPRPAPHKRPPPAAQPTKD